MRHTLALAFTFSILAAVAVLGGVRPSAASAPTLRLAASTGDLSALAPLTVEVRVLDATDLGAWEFTLVYDRSFLTLTGMEAASGLGNDQPGCDPSGERCVLLLGPRPTLDGMSLGAVSYGAAPGLNGEGVIARLHFQPTGRTGSTTVSLADALVTDIQGQAITPQTEAVTVPLGHMPSHRVFLPSVTNQ